ncbi:MAG: hypothetical protein LBM38_00655 [Clostridiales bacterium]|jgi:hypothetical protein|nr:hypothetical protein [Clostridiales bacterium]
MNFSDVFKEIRHESKTKKNELTEDSLIFIKEVAPGSYQNSYATLYNGKKFKMAINTFEKDSTINLKNGDVLYVPMDGVVLQDIETSELMSVSSVDFNLNYKGSSDISYNNVLSNVRLNIKNFKI